MRNSSGLQERADGFSPSENFDGDPAKLTLYQSFGCGYSTRVTAALDQLGLEIATKDIFSEPGARDELIAGGGRRTVPCLRIEGAGDDVEWMYESRDIVDFLRQHFDN